MNKDDIAHHKAATGLLDYIRIDPMRIPKALESRELTQSIYDELVSHPKMQKSGLDFDDSHFSSSAKKWSSVTDNGLYSVGYRHESNEGASKLPSTTTTAASPMTSASPILTGNLITAATAQTGISAAGISAAPRFNEIYTITGSVSSAHHMHDERISELLATIKDLEAQITLLTNKTHETFSTDEKFDPISAWDRAMSSISK